jgi:hypothetical protein
MVGRCQKPPSGGNQGYFKGKRPVNVRVDEMACHLYGLWYLGRPVPPRRTSMANSLCQGQEERRMHLRVV